jgi:hypothetical protein
MSRVHAQCARQKRQRDLGQFSSTPGSATCSTGAAGFRSSAGFPASPSSMASYLRGILAMHPQHPSNSTHSRRRAHNNSRAVFIDRGTSAQELRPDRLQEAAGNLFSNRRILQGAERSIRDVLRTFKRGRKCSCGNSDPYPQYGIGKIGDGVGITV